MLALFLGLLCEKSLFQDFTGNALWLLLFVNFLHYTFFLFFDSFMDSPGACNNVAINMDMRSRRTYPL